VLGTAAAVRQQGPAPSLAGALALAAPAGHIVAVQHTAAVAACIAAVARIAVVVVARIAVARLGHTGRVGLLGRIEQAERIGLVGLLGCIGPVAQGRRLERPLFPFLLPSGKGAICEPSEQRNTSEWS